MQCTKASLVIVVIGDHTCPYKKRMSQALNKLYRIKQTLGPPRYSPRSSCQHFNSKWTIMLSKKTPVLYWIRNVADMKQKLKKDIEPFGHNFEAIISFVKSIPP